LALPRAAIPHDEPRRALPPTRLRPPLRAPDGIGSGPQLEPAGRDRILIVEDDFLIAAQMEAALTEAGFEVAGVATTADEAVALGARRRPALVVMDVRLVGGRDGIDAAIELFEEHGIRCLFATAHCDEEVRQRAKPAGPVGWLQKPYTAASLVEMVRRALSDLNKSD
jgi:two-component system, response regulator PdtaR